MSAAGLTGSYMCDRCGESVGNGGIGYCITVSDLDPENEGSIRTLHFCRKNQCARKVLSNRNLKAYLELKKKQEDWQAMLLKVEELEQQNTSLAERVRQLEAETEAM